MGVSQQVAITERSSSEPHIEDAVRPNKTNLGHRSKNAWLLKEDRLIFFSVSSFRQYYQGTDFL